MVDLTLELDDAGLRTQFGGPTLQRALEYARGGKVLAVRPGPGDDGELTIRGHVEASAGQVYDAHVTVVPSRKGIWIHGRCSCPVGEGCKHIVALLLTVPAEQAAEHAAGGSSTRWERQLAAVLDELGAAAPGRSGDAKPLALQVELHQPTARRSRSRSCWWPTGLRSATSTSAPRNRICCWAPSAARFGASSPAARRPGSPWSPAQVSRASACTPSR